MKRRKKELQQKNKVFGRSGSKIKHFEQSFSKIKQLSKGKQLSSNGFFPKI